MLTLKQKLPVSIPSKLIEFIARHVQKDGLSTINFRDTSYSPTEGGFRPVEIMVEKRDTDFAIHYYTEFSFQGPPCYAELGKSNDFDFIANAFMSEQLGYMPITEELNDAFEMFVNNTMNYFGSNCFDEVRVAHIGGNQLL
ncbi:DUF2787 family protein [Vibrio cholerae]|jgi:hypothetical protein|uniref:DUF2787 family protein n=1 Tax=Vibrio fluvialis TaxID=676 RepID=UPI0025726ACE|nr:DUF2787 family protein [Vibrio fluvialis]BEI26571.1 hypothetical protein KKIDH5335_49030 [Vibrio fluvialis]